VTLLRCGRILMVTVTNLQTNLNVKELWQLVSVSQIYKQKYSGIFLH